MPLKNYNRIINETPLDVKYFVQDSMNILERLHELLDEKFDGKQKLLAEKLGKSEAEVSKMLGGVQNFTLMTLSKLKAAFGESIIAVCTNHAHSTFVQVKTAPMTGHVRFIVKKDGQLEKQTFVASHSLQGVPSTEKRKLV